MTGFKKNFEICLGLRTKIMYLHSGIMTLSSSPVCRTPTSTPHLLYGTTSCLICSSHPNLMPRALQRRFITTMCHCAFRHIASAGYTTNSKTMAIMVPVLTKILELAAGITFTCIRYCDVETGTVATESIRTAMYAEALYKLVLNYRISANVSELFSDSNRTGCMLTDGSLFQLNQHSTSQNLFRQDLDC